MEKPKENTIAKIDDLNSALTESALSEPGKELIGALARRCHNMNIHKAKLVDRPHSRGIGVRNALEYAPHAILQRLQQCRTSNSYAGTQVFL